MIGMKEGMPGASRPGYTNTLRNRLRALGSGHERLDKTVGLRVCAQAILGGLVNYKRLTGDMAERISYLTQLASLEVGKRHENGVRARIAAAHFPVINTIESFDFALQP